MSFGCLRKTRFGNDLEAGLKLEHTEGEGNPPRLQTVSLVVWGRIVCKVHRWRIAKRLDRFGQAFFSLPCLKGGGKNL